VTVTNDNHRNQTIPKRLAGYESVVMQPVFLGQEQAIDYAKGRACFGSGEIRVLN
jgi:hypothetical protein